MLLLSGLSKQGMADLHENQLFTDKRVFRHLMATAIDGHGHSNGHEGQYHGPCIRMIRFEGIYANYRGQILSRAFESNVTQNLLR